MDTLVLYMTFLHKDKGLHLGMVTSVLTVIQDFHLKEGHPEPSKTRGHFNSPLDAIRRDGPAIQSVTKHRYPLTIDLLAKAMMYHDVSNPVMKTMWATLLMGHFRLL